LFFSINNKKRKTHYKIGNTFFDVAIFIFKRMAKLKRTLILRITEDQFRYILNSSIKEEKSKSKIIREAIEKHRKNGKN